MRVDLRFWIGRIVGAAAGIPAGPFGIIFGFVIGFLLDQILRFRSTSFRIRRFVANPAHPAPSAHSPLLLAIAGIGVYLAEENRSVSVRQVRIIRDTIVTWFPEVLVRSQALDDMIDDIVACAGAIDGPALSHVLAPYLRQAPASDVGQSSMADAECARFLGTISATRDGTVGEATRARLGEICRRLNLSVETVLASAEERRRPDSDDAVPRKLDPESCSILGVGADATVAEIKQVFRSLAAQFHPDAVRGLDADRQEQAARAFIRIKSAYDTLLAQAGAGTGVRGSIRRPA